MTIRMGVDYYPEHWDRSLWGPDATLMAETGIRLVRVAEFAWCRLEPTDGHFDFAWLDEAIDLFHANGIQVILGTPSCTPPQWLIERHPEIVPVDAERRPQSLGIRGYRCVNSPAMRERTAAVVAAMAERYASHPAVVAWQIDNEFSLPGCHCATCNERFRAWLQARYPTVADLNRAWGLVVWSGEVSSWSQVTTPLGGTTWRNPSRVLDWQRFESESVAEFQRLQVDIIRRRCPGHPITHNIWSYPMALDYNTVCADLDVVSLDYYPTTNPDKADTSPYGGALTLDLARGIKRAGFWIMETLSGPPGCWFPMWRTPYPGLIRAFSWQTIARGAEMVVHFRWRSATAGAEQFWHGLIDHSNVPGRRFAEYRRLVDEVNRLAPRLAGTTVRNQVALLHSHDTYSALQQQAQAEGFDYFDILRTHHRALTRLGVGVDALDLGADLSGYRLVVAPTVYLLDEALAARLDAYVAGGGTLVLTCRTGVKNRQNVCWMLPLPGLLAPTVGATVAEYDPIGKHPHRLRTAAGRSYACGQWADLLSPGEATPMAWYEDDFFAGTPAVTRHRRGRGEVWYAGTVPEEAFWSDLYTGLVDGLAIPRVAGLPDGVQASVREGNGERFLFLINLSREAKPVDVGRPLPRLLGGGQDSAVITLEPYGVEVLAGW